MTETTTVSCLSPEIEGLLLDVLAEGFTVYCCGPKAAPTGCLIPACGAPPPRSLASLRLSIPHFGSRWPASHPPTPKVTPTLPTSPPRPADPWRDAEGTPIPEQCRVEQATVDEKHGALPSRLHRQGQVTGRGTILLYVLFDHENQLIALRPHLVRVLDTPNGC